MNAIIEDGAKPEDAYDDAVEEVERLVSLLEHPLEHRPVSLAAEPPAAVVASPAARKGECVAWGDKFIPYP